MLLGAIAASILGNSSPDKAVLRAAEWAIKADQNCLYRLIF